MPAVTRFPLSVQWPHYLRAVVDISFPAYHIRVAPGCAHGPSGLPHPLGSAGTIHIVTAFNPGGHHSTAPSNLRAQHELLHVIDRCGLQWWPAVGGDGAGTHAEISVAISGMSDAQARAIGRTFGQDAVFAWTPTSWRLLACTDTAHDVTVPGWHATTLASASHP
ncbi:DUF3293 domain-containing protein [Streptomyces sp. NPDC056628]|uniref:DUF3293 domain-containing protein n=1 Tax=Streptomyces sp. NPDC056628 TaxID=3345882 RepID=UPI00367C1A7C